MTHGIHSKSNHDQRAIDDSLVLVIEECSEVIKNITKAFRGGLLFKIDEEGKNNLELIVEELVDLQVVTDIFKELVELSQSREEYVTMYNAKLDKLKIWSELGHILPKLTK